MSITKSLFILFLIFSATHCEDDQNTLIKLVKKFLQNYVDNDIIVRFIEYIRSKDKHNYPDHYEQNKAAFKNHLSTIKGNKGFIEDQSNYKDMTYGMKTLNYNGCGVIATYNVMFALTNNWSIDIADIIRNYEKDGILLSGLFGTSMNAIGDFLKRKGYKVQLSTKKAEYDSIGNNMGAFILMVFNNIDDITDAMHFMAITKSNGKFYVHNNGNKNVAYTSISDVLARINGGKAKDVIFLGASK